MKEMQKYRTKFELVQLAAVFAMVFLIVFLCSENPNILWIYAAGACLLLGIFAYWLLLPLHKLWFGLAKLLSNIVSPVIIGILFYCFLTPLALLRRIFGTPGVQIHFSERSSYWNERPVDAIAQKDLEYQF